MNPGYGETFPLEHYIEGQARFRLEQEQDACQRGLELCEKYGIPPQYAPAVAQIWEEGKYD